MSKASKVIFIDRDGVINKDPGGWTEHNYVTRWEQFIFLPDSIKALQKLNEAGYDIIVVSNQAGVAKGYYSQEKLDQINRRMIEEIEKNGAKLSKTYYCIHQDSDNCNCRKPKTGLFEQAEKELGIKASESYYYIGDTKTDVEAGNKMRLKTILLLTGKTDQKATYSWSIKPDFVFNDLLEATNFILKGE